MRAVLYASDFEPITVIDLPEFAMEYLEKYRFVRLPVLRPPQTTPWDEASMPEPNFPLVKIWAERLRHPRGEHLMLFTEDEEMALLLKSTFLPGQRSALHDVERRAFAQGFLNALQHLGN
jgi:hypothetical protein